MRGARDVERSRRGNRNERRCGRDKHYVHGIGNQAMAIECALVTKQAGLLGCVILRAGRRASGIRARGGNGEGFSRVDMRADQYALKQQRADKRGEKTGALEPASVRQA